VCAFGLGEANEIKPKERTLKCVLLGA